MTGKEVADVLREVAQGYALQDDRRRAASFTKAVEAVERTRGTTDLSGMSVVRLKSIESVGPSIATCIKQIVDTGTCDRLKTLRSLGFPSVKSIMEIEGIGPATARDLWKTYGITTREGLLKAFEDGTLYDPKLLRNVKKALTTTTDKIPRKTMEKALEPVVSRLWELDFVEDLEVAGAIRRKEDLVEDASILVKVDATKTVKLTQRLTTVCRDIFLRVNSGEEKRIKAILKVDGVERSVDVIIVQPESWGSALNHYTGPKAHNIYCRDRARKRGYTLNEYAVYKVKTQRKSSAYRDAEVVEVRERVGGAKEMDLFDALGIGFIPPEKRTGGPYTKKDFVDAPDRPGRSEGDIPIADSVDMRRFALIMD